MGSPPAAVKFLNAIVNHFSEEGRPDQFDTTALKGLKSVQAERGRVTCRLPVTPEVQNRYGTLHGGCIATLVDTVGTAALVTISRRSGVSLNINIDYLNRMPGGNEVEVDAKVVKVGKSIATINVELRDTESGKVVAQGTHVKFLAEKEPDILQLAGVRQEAPALAKAKL